MRHVATADDRQIGVIENVRYLRVGLGAGEIHAILRFVSTLCSSMLCSSKLARFGQRGDELAR